MKCCADIYLYIVIGGMSKANNTEASVNAVIRHQLQMYKVDTDVLKAVLPEDVYGDWMVLCQAIDANLLMMFGCEYCFFCLVFGEI
jgi:hypothetical protein